jgi:diacylglycerol kinase (ATP)
VGVSELKESVHGPEAGRAHSARVFRRRTLRLQRRGRVFSSRVLRSFTFALAGLAYLFRTQRNARIHAAIGLSAGIVAAWLRISSAGWAIIVLTIAMVLILEGLNTAVEALVDLASPAYHDLAKTAKDVSAATVLIGAMASVVVGLLVLGPPLWHRLFG